MAAKTETIDDLEDLALELGASLVSEDGRVFNADHRQGVRRKKAPELDPQVALLKALLQQMQNPPVVNTTVNVPDQAPPTVLVEPKINRAVSWTFDFERNGDGTIKRIRATPVQ